MDIDSYARIFRHAEPGQSPFVNEDWSVLLFVEELPRHVAPYFAPLARMATGIGDLRAIIADETEPQTRVVTNWSASKFGRGRFDVPLTALVFGDSERWGAILSDDGFTCLGAEHGLVEIVAIDLGSRGKIRAEFEKWLRTATGLMVSPKKAEWLRQLNA